MTGRAYHYDWQGDDPPLTANPLRIFSLALKWLRGIETPREYDELINDLFYLRQKINGWG